MSIISFIQGLGATHLFTLSNEGTNVAHDLGNSVDPSRISGGTYSFQTDPVCYGVSHCLRSTTSTNSSVDGAIIENRNDINGSNGNGNDSSAFDYRTGTYSVLLWSRQSGIFNPSCIYEQGGGVNNFAMMGGAQVTFQAADSGQDFLIVAGNSLARANRDLLIVGVWEYRTQHPGSNNRVLMYINGILQGVSELTGTDQFPAHSGDIVIGNSSEALRSFEGTTFISQTVSKDANMLALFKNASITEAQAREVFERSVLPEVLIDADTVVNQQAALDALSGSVYVDANCAIEIRQATDATDYSLDLNNIKFVQNESLRDIAVKYVGPNTLTLVNLGGSDAEVTASPIEQDLDGSTVLVGGGSVVIQNPATLTIANIVSGAALTIFDDEDPDPQALGTILADQASIAGTTYQFGHSKAGDQIVVQMIASGYEEINLIVPLTSDDQSVVLEQTTEGNL